MSRKYRSPGVQPHSSRRRLDLLLLGLVLAGGSGCMQAPQAENTSPAAVRVSAPARSGAALPSGEALSAARRKISSALLTAIEQSRGSAAASPPLETGVQIDSQGRTVVDITADVSDELLAKLGALGGDILDSVPQFRTIRARVPLAQLETVAAGEDVSFIQPAQEAITNLP